MHSYIYMIIYVYLHTHVYIYIHTNIYTYLHKLYMYTYTYTYYYTHIIIHTSNECTININQGYLYQFTLPLCSADGKFCACFHLQSDLFDQGRVALGCENGQFIQLKQDLHQVGSCSGWPPW